MCMKKSVRLVDLDGGVVSNEIWLNTFWLIGELI